MKYAVFYGETYEAAGGWRDLEGIADTLDEAKAFINFDNLHVDWAHIVVLDDNPRIVSLRYKNYSVMNWYFEAGVWYDEGTKEFELLNSNDTFMGMWKRLESEGVFKPESVD